MDQVLLGNQEEQALYKRAEELSASGQDISYAVFLCHELLRRNPDYVEARQLLLRLRKDGAIRRTWGQKLGLFLGTWIKLAFLSLRLSKKREECLALLDSLLDVSLKGDAVWRLMSRLAIQLEYFQTTIFCIENIDVQRRKLSDIIRLGEAYLGCGHFSEAVEVANFVLGRDPENIRARDLLWQSSVDDTLGKQHAAEAAFQGPVSQGPASQESASQGPVAQKASPGALARSLLPKTSA
jgi:tetratricopeptide (TPR) repeat protein